MTERKTVVYPNPQVLAEAVAARTLLTIIDLLAEPNRKRVDIAVTGGTDGNRVFAAMNASPLNDARGLEPCARVVGRRALRGGR